MNLDRSRQLHLERFCSAQAVVLGAAVCGVAAFGYESRQVRVLDAALLMTGWLLANRVAARYARRGELSRSAWILGVAGLATGALAVALLPFAAKAAVLLPLPAVALTLAYLPRAQVRSFFAAAALQACWVIAAGWNAARPAIMNASEVELAKLLVLIATGYLTCLVAWQYFQVYERAREEMLAARRELEAAFAALKVGEARFRSLVVSSSDLIWNIDAQGQCTEPSATWTAFTGQTFAEASGAGWLEAVHPEDREVLKGAWLEARAQGRSFQVDYRLRRADGTWAHMEARCAPVLEADGSRIREWTGASTDVSEQRQMTTRLADQRATLQGFYDAAPFLMGILELRGEELTTVSLNRSARELTDALRSAPLGCDCGGLCEALQGLPKLAREVLASGERRHAELQLAAGGSARLFDVTLAEVPGASPGAQRVALVAEELTEKRIFEKRLERADRLAALGQLAAGVAHEINNPLAYVRANLAYLRDELPDARSQGEVQAAFSDAMQGVERIASIVTDLRTFSRDEEHAPQLCDPGEAIREALRMARLRFGSGIHLDLELPESLPRVRANPRKLGQVILNLLVNASDAVEDAQHQGLPRARAGVRLAVRAAGDALVAEVEDSGTGIPPEVAAKLFQPFFTTKPPGRGTGLGLAICREYALRWGGDLSVENLPAGGARFSLRIPLEDSAEAEALPSPDRRASGG